MEDPPSTVRQGLGTPPGSITTFSANSSYLDIPSTIYMIEDASVKSSTASFTTTGAAEPSVEPPVAYDEPYQNIPSRATHSPAALLHLRARPKSLGMIGSQTTDFLGITSVPSPLPTPPLSPSPSTTSSLDLSIPPIPDVPTPPYEELEGLSFQSLCLSVSSESLRDEPEVENDYLPPFRFATQPRPEEGNEILPDYSCTVFRSGIVNQKIECVYPGLPAKKREWIKVYMLVLGTGLRVYPIQPDGTLPSNFNVNAPHREYTLQYAEAGIASDYVKKRYVLRVRVEGEQFLMQCSDEEERDAWVESVQAGSSIALALEDRNMPKYVTLPRRRRGRYASASVSRSRPTRNLRAIRTSPLRTVECAPSVPSSSQSNFPHRTTSHGTIESTYSGTDSCTGDAPHDPCFDAATALALCLDAGRSRPHPRERIVLSVLTARQHRQNEWVIINGTKRKINPKSNELEEALPPGICLEEDEYRARLMKSKRGLTSRIFKFF